MFSPAAQVPRLNFVPTPEFPALQYFGEVEKGRQADLQRVKSGDFILEVSKRPFLLHVSLVKELNSQIELDFAVVKFRGKWCWCCLLRSRHATLLPMVGRSVA